MSVWRKTTLFGSSLLVSAFLYYPSVAAASATVELVSVTPDAEQIDTSQMQPPEDVQLFAFTGTADQAYDLQFSSTESPAVVIGINGDMTPEQNWSYDENTNIVSVHLQYTGTTARGENTQEGNDPMANSFMLAFVFAVEHGQDGPPVEMTGSWFTTNVQQWELIPPSPDKPAFGYKLSGSAGTQGFFHMFIPDSMIELLGKMSGKALTINDLAVFNGDAQSSLAVQAVTGGALVEINILFKEDLNTVKRDPTSNHYSASLISKTITVQEQLPFSLTPTLSTVKKGKKVQLYGWISTGTPKTTMKIWRKLAGESDYTPWQILKLKKNGYFLKKFKPQSTATYKATYQGLTSPEQAITVK